MGDKSLFNKELSDFFSFNSSSTLFWRIHKNSRLNMTMVKSTRVRVTKLERMILLDAVDLSIKFAKSLHFATLFCFFVNSHTEVELFLGGFTAMPWLNSSRYFPVFFSAAVLQQYRLRFHALPLWLISDLSRANLVSGL